MRNNTINNNLLFISFLLTFIGYYVILLILFNFNMYESSRLVTIPVRIIITFTLSILFFKNIAYNKRNFVIPLFIVFSIFYILRIAIDYSDSEEYHRSISEVFLFFLSFCFIPFISIYKLNLNQERIKTILTAILVSGGLFSILVLFYYGKFLGKVSRLSSNIVGEEVMSPLALSYCSALIIGTLLFYSMCNKLTKKRSILIIITIILAIIPFFLGASRGSLFSLFVPFILYLFRKNKLNFKIKSVFFLVILIVTFVYLDMYLQSGFIDRLLNTNKAIEKGEGSAVRLQIWETSLKQFSNNPIFGDRLGVKGENGYPHNLFIESLQTTGILGFFPFLTLNIMAWKIVIKVLKENIQNFWMVVIFIQAFIMNMFSGSIHTASWYWFSLALVFSLNKTLKTT